MGYEVWGMGYGVWGMGYGVWGMVMPHSLNSIPPPPELPQNNI